MATKNTEVKEVKARKPRKTKQSNLSLAKVKKTSKQMDTTEIHIIESETYKNEQITFHPIFSETKIEELFVEFGQLISEAKEKEIEISKQMEMYILQMLICKKFTHFDSEIEIELLGFLNVLEHFRSTGLYKELLDEVFLQDQIRKVFDRLTDFAATSLLTLDLEEQMQNKLANLKLKNKSVFDQLAQLNVENNVADEGE